MRYSWPAHSARRGRGGVHRQEHGLRRLRPRKSRTISYTLFPRHCCDSPWRCRAPRRSDTSRRRAGQCEAKIFRNILHADKTVFSHQLALFCRNLALPVDGNTAPCRASLPSWRRRTNPCKPIPDGSARDKACQWACPRLAAPQRDPRGTPQRCGLACL